MKYASLRQGLVGAWCPSLGPSGNTLIDRSDYGNHGTLTNMDAATDWVGSRYGWALDFDGSNDYTTAPRTPFSNTTKSQMSFFAWACIRTGYGLIALYNSSAGFFYYAGESVLTQRLYIGTTPYPGLNSSSFLTANSWAHIGFTFENNAVVFFLNGRRDGTATGIASPTFSTASLLFGGFGGGETWNGCFAEFLLYDRVVTDSEVRSLAIEPGIALRPERTSVFFGSTSNRRRRLLTGMV